MTDMKQKDIIKLLESNGWTLARKSKHLIYKKNKSTIVLPHSKTIKRKTVKDIMKHFDRES